VLVRGGNRNRTPRHPSAFSLVELLVVIAILVLVVALALPAITRSIEAADRNRCGSNQAKLALGMSSYDTRQGCFPGIRNNLYIKSPSGQVPQNQIRDNGAVLVGGQFSDFPVSTPSWFIMILPHIGFNSIFDDLLDGKVWFSNTSDSKTSQQGLAQDLTVCPSRADFYAMADSHTGKNMFYQANGAGASIASGSFNRNDGAIGDNANGIFVSLADVVAGDGAATTLLIAEGERERWYPFLVSSNSRGRPAGVTYSKYFTSMSGDNGGYIAHPDAGGNLLFGFSATGTVGSTTPVINNGSNYPSSIGRGGSAVHAGGANVAFVDGSTRFLKEDLAPYVYANLVTHRSVWNGNSSTGTFTPVNSLRVDTFLQLQPAPKPYKLKPEDY
jgi:prepilin-type processing-associated H-X9-DG protein/prepilin-type N-terminal cleavage/methylation domain-containing protein